MPSRNPSCSKSVVRQGAACLVRSCSMACSNWCRSLMPSLNWVARSASVIFWPSVRAKRYWRNCSSIILTPPLCRVLGWDLKKFSLDGRRRTAKIFWDADCGGNARGVSSGKRTQESKRGTWEHAPRRVILLLLLAGEEPAVIIEEVAQDWSSVFQQVVDPDLV